MKILLLGYEFDTSTAASFNFNYLNTITTAEKHELKPCINLFYLDPEIFNQNQKTCFVSIQV